MGGGGWGLKSTTQIFSIGSSTLSSLDAKNYLMHPSHFSDKAPWCTHTSVCVCVGGGGGIAGAAVRQLEC